MKRHNQIRFICAGLFAAYSVYSPSGADAEPIVLRANAVPEVGNVVRPLLPPDTEVSEDSEKVQKVSGTEKAEAPREKSEASQNEVEPAKVVEKRASNTTKKDLGIQLSHEAGVDSISLATGVSEPKFVVHELQNPHRLVVDIDGPAGGASRTVKASELDLVSTIRVGSHPNKSRVVLDLSSSAPVEYKAAVQNGAIRLSLHSVTQEARSAESASDMAETLSSEKSLVEERINEAIAEEATQKSRPESSDEIDAVDIDADHGQQLAQAPEEKATVETVSLKTSNTIKGVRITKVSLSDTASGAPQIRLSYLGKPDFQLQRTAPSEYVLIVRRAALDKSVDRKPLFAASTSSSIRSARTTVDGPNVLIRVFTQPSAYLTAREEKGGILITETQDLTQVVKDIRAQMAPPAEATSGPDGTTSAEGQKPQATAPTAPVLPAVDAKPSKDAASPPNSLTAKDAPKKPVASRAKGRTTTTEISDVDIDALLGDKSKYTGKLISLDLQETDIDNALRIIAEVSNLNIVASEDVKGKVTLRLLDVPWDQALDVILKTNGLDKVVEGSVMRIAPVDKLKVERESLKEARDAEEELEPLSVKYLRVSYAKAAEIKSIVETVLSERGSVAYDERSNQLIVKDVRAGLKNVVELVSKVDLRTPQVLLETQIVESSRNLARDLGSQLGFQYIQSPSTGNGLGNNFPSSFAAGGSVDSSSLLGSSFPAPVSLAGGSAVSMLFDSADGTKSLELRLSQLEQEGRVRIISRPAVATTNNKAAEIKSVEKYRVRLPNGGVSVATGSGASASGTSSTATEVIEAGITLNVTPQASPDYYILLDIKARSSTFGNTARFGDANIPNEFERSASSTVLVSSGQTFALGGIYKVSESDQVAGVPFFKDLPVLGTFFRRTNTSDSDEELLFFITPRIVEGSFDHASVKSMS